MWSTNVMIEGMASGDSGKKGKLTEFIIFKSWNMKFQQFTNYDVLKDTM